MECAIGLRGTDGRHYSLTNLFQHDPEYKFSTTGLLVIVSGIFSLEVTTGPDGNKYDVAGSIDVTSIKEAKAGSIQSGTTQVSIREGQRESSFLLEKIYPDRVTGLNFWEYPVATGEGNPLTLYIGEVVSNGCTIQLTLTHIEGNVATFTKNVDITRPCPICLAEHTLIDTPAGGISVDGLEKGMAVWTVDGNGERVSATVLEVAKTPVPATHRVVHLVLDDGRELFVSPGHPTGDGRTIADLYVGDSLDGAQVETAELVSYQSGYTYDILPSGDTGLYFADGILVGSTLH